MKTEASTTDLDRVELEVEVEVEVEIIVPEPPTETATDARPEDIIRAKIIATLQVYPVLSPSMLQAALGASLSPSIWKPTLHTLIQEGVISQWDESPRADDNGSTNIRQRPYPCLALAPEQQHAA